MSKMFVSYMPAAVAAINVASEKALIATADVGRNQTVKNLTAAGGPRTGHVYKKPGTNVYYTASAPGQFPSHERFGQLRGTVQRKVVGGDVQIGSDSEYALPLEKKPANKGGRPWLKRSLDQAKPKMLLELNKRWF